jgi:hypothetical protein
LAVAFLVAGCGFGRDGSTTIETDNVLSRMIPVDSVLLPRTPDSGVASVALLRFDASNFDFARSVADGSDIAVQRTDGAAIPFRIVFWDSLAARGRLEVGLDGGLDAKGARFVVRWGLPRASRQDSSAVWNPIPDSQRRALSRVLVDDFEGGSLQNRLPDAGSWEISGSDSTVLTGFGIASSPAGRTGHAMHLSYVADSGVGRYAMAKTALAGSPRCFRTLDSIELWVKGQGNLSIALEHQSGTQWYKAWAHHSLDTGWQRVRVRPQDFDPASGSYNSVGWSGIRDSVTHLTLFTNAGTAASELWVDDIRVHGIWENDLR